MRSLLLRYGIKHHLRHRFRLAMVLLSLALGVAIFVSSYESVVAAESAIARSANAMASKAEWEVSRGRYLGIEASYLDKIRQIPGAVAAPIVESTVSTVEKHPTNFLVVGLDLDTDSAVRLFGAASDIDPIPFVKLKFAGSGIVLPRAYAREHGLEEGSTFRLQSSKGIREMPVVGILDNRRLVADVGAGCGFMEVGQAAKLFGQAGFVDKIDVAGVPKAVLEKACPGCQIERPGRISSAAEDALGRIRSLLGVSMIALLVGVLLIYNTVQVSVLERVKDIAVLRAIGATRTQIFALLLSEWFVIGLAGSAAGIAIGSGLAYALVEYTKKTVNTMVPLVADAHVEVGPFLVIAAFAIGVGTAVVAAFFPAWVAANVRPLEVLRPYTYRRAHSYVPAAIAGLLIFVVANVVLMTQSFSYVLGLSITGFEFFGVALMFPQVVLVLGRYVRAAMRQGKNPAPFLALDSLMKSPHRTAFTIMTFGCSLMMTVATKTLVAGFEASTGDWMNSAFPFDISVMGNDVGSSVYGSQVLPDALTNKLRSADGVSSAYSVRKLFTPYRSQDVMVIGIDIDGYLAARLKKNMGVWPPALKDAAQRAEFKAGKGAFVSTNFAALFNVHQGQTLRLDTPSGPAEFEVFGEIEDYSWQHGAFMLYLPALRRVWKDDGVSYIDVSVAPGHTIPEVRERVQAVASTDRSAFAFDKAQIRKVTESVLEQAVAMANLQAMIGILIGIIGIVNSIWIGVMNRKREIALWRAIGVTRRQIGFIVVFEGVFIALVAALVGTVGGLYGGWEPLRSFSFGVSGYLYPMVVPWQHLAFVTALALALGLLAGILPAKQAARLPILESIGYE